MSNTPFVTIVTPSFNQGLFLEETIQSVLSQTYPKIEYLVIDGSSTDQSLDIIKKYQDQLTCWVSEPDRGQSNAINKGLKKAKGDILGWLNSDDTLEPGTVSRIVEVFQGNSDVDVVHGKNNRIDARGRLKPTPKVPIEYQDFAPQNALCENTVNSAGAFWHRRIMARVGFLDEDLHYAMDYEYWLRMIISGARFERIGNPPLANFRVDDHTKTVSQLESSASEAMEVLEKYLSDPDLRTKLGISARQLKYCARKGRSYRCLRAAYGSFRSKGLNLNSVTWFAKAIRWYPLIILQMRWLELWMASRRNSQSINSSTHDINLTQNNL